MNEEEHAVLRALQSAEEAIAIAIEKAGEAFRRYGRIIYVGAGTSGRIATLDAAEMIPTFGLESDIFVALMAGGQVATGRPVENAEDDVHEIVSALNQLKLTTNDVLFGLAASGSTPYVLSAIRHANQKGIWTCGIANNRNSKLLEEADHAILLDTGAEVLTGSTRLKAGTSQKLVLNRISTGAMVLNGKVVENLMIDVKATNAKLRERCVRIVSELRPVTNDESFEILVRNDFSIRAALTEIDSVPAGRSPNSGGF